MRKEGNMGRIAVQKEERERDRGGAEDDMDVPVLVVWGIILQGEKYVCRKERWDGCL